MRLKKTFLIIFLSLLQIALLYARQEAPRVSNGVLDLRAWDFNKEGIVRLDGTWGFYWNQLLDPVSVRMVETSPSYIEFPRLWNNETVNGVALSGKGFATYSLTILLPASRPALSLSVEDFFTSYKLFINGEVFSQNGQPGTSSETTIPQWFPSTKPLRYSSDTLRFILQVANFEHRKGGGSQSLFIGEQSQMSLIREKELAFDWILAGAMFMGGIFFFGLYLFGRHDKPMYFFALFCIVYSYRNIGSDLYAVSTVFQSLPWTVIIRLEYMCVFSSLYFFVRYLMSLYPEEIYKPPLTLFIWITLALNLASLIGPVWLFTALLPYYLFLILLAIVYASYVVILAAAHQRPGAIYAVAAKAAVFAIVGYNILVYFGITQRDIFFNFLAHIVFFFCQALILSFRFAFHLTTAKVQAEKASKAKTEFLSTMSHEMRTPLNAVIGMTNYLLEDNPKMSQKENLSTLKFSAEHLLHLINDVLDYSKIESGKVEFSPEATPIKKLLTSLSKLHEKKAIEKGLDFQLKITDEVPEAVWCDSVRLAQVITNLVDNAIKFTSKGFVHLCISVDGREKNKVKLLFEVVDSGIGIEPRKQKMIFESFEQANSSTTREFGGTGLGLAICRKLLQLQGSDIHLVSDAGVGSRFYFSIWLEEAELPSTLANIPQAENGIEFIREKRVLVVEDNPMNILVIKKFLTKWGAQVEVAENGLLAVEKHFSHPYDVILMDLQMPVMDGYVATTKIREKDKKVPIIAITAAVPFDVQERIFNVGMNDYITKPFIPDDLLKKLRKQLVAVI